MTLAGSLAPRRMCWRPRQFGPWHPCRDAIRLGSRPPGVSLADSLHPPATVCHAVGVGRGLADACLVRMTGLEPRSPVVTTDADFAFYRRNGREVVPHVLPG